MNYYVEVLAPDVFTPRQTEVLVGMAKGLSDKQIARVLNISHETVAKHCRAIYERMDAEHRCSNARMRAVGLALADGVIAIIKK